MTAVEGEALTVGVVVAAMDSLYPPALAASWDAVGLVCGSPELPVTRILLSVDCGEQTSIEAVDRGADLLITHHPLFLSGVTSVAATDARGRIVHRLIRGGVSLFTAHTNADSARRGVSDALAAALGVADTQALEPAELPDAASGGEGIGRIGTLSEPMRLTDFVQRVASALPRTSRGVHASGDLTAEVRRVAVCGGAGDSLLPVAKAAGADVMVTSDLKHHRTSDHIADGGCAVIDVAHWASEWPWLEWCRRDLLTALGPSLAGGALEIMISEECTDPWIAHYDSPEPL